MTTTLDMAIWYNQSVAVYPREPHETPMRTAFRLDILRNKCHLTQEGYDKIWAMMQSSDVEMRTLARETCKELWQQVYDEHKIIESYGSKT